MRNSNIDEHLRAWSEGSSPIDAATELPIRALGRCFAQPGSPCIRHVGGDHWWIDFDANLDTDPFGYMSGGERWVLAMATSLGAADPSNSATQPRLRFDHPASRPCVPPPTPPVHTRCTR